KAEFLAEFDAVGNGNFLSNAGREICQLAADDIVAPVLNLPKPLLVGLVCSFAGERRIRLQQTCRLNHRLNCVAVSGNPLVNSYYGAVRGYWRRRCEHVGVKRVQLLAEEIQAPLVLSITSLIR